MIRCIVVEMPITIRGFTKQDVNGDYTIVINGLLSDEQKNKTLCHELSHIEREDFISTKPVKEIEKAVNGH